MKRKVELAYPVSLSFRFRYEKEGQICTRNVLETIKVSEGELKITAPESGFLAVELTCFHSPVLMDECALCFSADDNKTEFTRPGNFPATEQYFIADKTIVWENGLADQKGVIFKYSIVSLPPAYYSNDGKSDFSAKVDRLEKENHQLRGAIDQSLQAASIMCLGRRARLMKLLTAFLHPNVAGEKSKWAVLFKKFILRKELSNNYNIYQEVIHPLVSCGKQMVAANNHYLRKTDFAGTVYIFASVPFDDIGGGQRSAQLTRCFLQRMYRVVYIYKYPKVEQGVPVANESVSPQFSHLYFNNVSSKGFFRDAPEDSVVIFEFPHPDYVPYLKEANKNNLHTVYELIDPWETSLGNGWYTREIENIFIKEAGKNVATAKVLHEKLVAAGRPDALYCPNAADTRYFNPYAALSKPMDFPGTYKKNILYFGSMYGEWFDWGALKTAAWANPKTGFLMIGDPPADRTNMPENILFLGMRQNTELENYLYASDAAIIPFRPSPLVDAVSPIKIFEYLFLAKPVITLDMKEVRDYPGVYQAKDEKEFAELCSLKNVSPISNLEHAQFISSHNWNYRADKICWKPQLKHTYSIIFLIHNNEKIIERTLTTLLKHVEGLPVEVIVVDNNSSDKGAEIVKTKFKDSVTLVSNPQNGCSCGRNLGAAHAHNEILVFFDSDQWFTSSAWLYDYDLLGDLHPEIGAFAWNAGWFADMNLRGPIVDYFPGRATGTDEYMTNGFRTDIHYLATSGFFIRKSLFDKIGGLDVAYDPTIFEDTDLSMRVLNAGYQIAYRDFAGIMHQPHQTTNANTESHFYKTLFAKNSSYFKKTWQGLLKEKYSLDVSEK